MEPYDSSKYINVDDTPRQIWEVDAHGRRIVGDDGCYVSIGEEPNINFYLDHQCDEWEIGDVEDAKRFVARLQELIDEVEKPNTREQAKALIRKLREDCPNLPHGI